MNKFSQISHPRRHEAQVSRGPRMAVAAAWTAALACAATLLIPGAASAATRASEAQLRYQQERAACMNGRSNQDRATCLKEAGAALAESKRNSLGRGDESALQRNRQARCDALKARDHEDCLRRMDGEGVTSGSARQGGIVRELTRPE
ncbi:MAG: hypothetical protein V4864_12170 [Pseudomonadota bacterium]